MSWRDEQSIGFSVQSPEDVERSLKAGANIVEIKYDKFAENDFPLMHYHLASLDFQHQINHENTMKLKGYAGNMKIQAHSALETTIDPTVESGLNIAIPSHWPMYLNKFMVFEEWYQKYGIGPNFTVHPPVISIGGKEIMSKDQAIEMSRLFIKKLDFMRMACCHKTNVLYENQTDPKEKCGCLGNKAIHFREIFKNTITMGICLDTGHIRLATDNTTREMIQVALPILNVHFHGNAGIFDAVDWKDDEHQPAAYYNVKGYQNFLFYFMRHRPVVILELASLKAFSDKDLADMIKQYRAELNCMIYEMIKYS